MVRNRHAESVEEAARQKQNDRGSKMKKRVKEKSIHHSIKNAKKYLHRTQDPKNPHRHRTIVCIIVDQFIIGTEGICKLTKDQISPHSKRLPVESYETFYETTLHTEMKRQYQVNIEGLKDLLLSPQSRKYSDGYATCVGTLENGYVRNIPLPRIPRIQSTNQVASVLI